MSKLQLSPEQIVSLNFNDRQLRFLERFVIENSERADKLSENLVQLQSGMERAAGQQRQLENEVARLQHELESEKEHHQRLQSAIDQLESLRKCSDDKEKIQTEEIKRLIEENRKLSSDLGQTMMNLQDEKQRANRLNELYQSLKETHDRTEAEHDARTLEYDRITNQLMQTIAAHEVNAEASENAIEQLMEQILTNPNASREYDEWRIIKGRCDHKAFMKQFLVLRDGIDRERQALIDLYALAKKRPEQEPEGKRKTMYLTRLLGLANQIIPPTQAKTK